MMIDKRNPYDFEAKMTYRETSQENNSTFMV